MDGVVKGAQPGVAYYRTPEEAEKKAAEYRKRQKVATDVFRVKKENDLYYIVQDIS